MNDRRQPSRDERTGSEQESSSVLEFRQRTSLAPGKPFTVDYYDRWVVELDLDEEEQRIARFLYFGEGNVYAPHTPAEAIAHFGISIEKIEEIEAKIARKMRHTTDKLDDLYPPPTPNSD